MTALEIRNLTKVYKSGIRAVDHMNLTIPSGDFFAVLGANGAGKSTTIGCMTTLLKKTAGTILIHGSDIDKQPEQAKSLLGVVPQEINLNIFETCEQILINQAGFYGVPRSLAKARANTLLEQLNLTSKRHQMARYLSGGMKRRLMIARALMHDPSILILDEPTAGVDVEIRRSLWTFLKEKNAQGTTIILTTHYLEEAEQLCKHLAIIHRGKIIENTSIQSLLATASKQTFIFTTLEPIKTLPATALQLDAYNFEIQVAHTMPLNELFAMFSAQGILIHSMRTKTNRLEALFMDRIQAGDEDE